MPELPEVENVARSVRPRAVGRRVIAVHIRRADVITGDGSDQGLLKGRTITGVLRVGKQLALTTHAGPDTTLTADAPVGQHDATPGETSNVPPLWLRRPASVPASFAGPTVCVQLGMTGSLRWLESVAQIRDIEPHVHVVWQLSDGVVLCFKDPRRFGGLTACESLAGLIEQKWRLLGPDGLSVTPTQLARALEGSVRPIKSALLDQFVVAGIGNIYADEALFAAGLHPLTPAGKVGPDRLALLARHVRRILKKSIDAGGSTIRDYANGEGDAGGYQDRHKVYGRAGLKCVRCRTLLTGLVLSGRSTVYCPSCQPG